MCLAQGPQRSDTGEARTGGPSVSSQALYHLECCDRSSVYIFYWIFFILSSYKDKNKSLDDFEILQDPTTDLWVSCPWGFGKIPIDL